MNLWQMTTGKDFPVKFIFNTSGWLTLYIMVLASCGAPKHEGAPQDSGRQKALPLSFQSVQTEVFESACVRCHDHYNSYENVLLELTQISESVAAGRMPKGGGLSHSSKTLLADWVAAGAPERAGDEPIMDIPKPKVMPNWKSLQSALFRPHCVACHSPQGEVPWLDFTTYESILSNKGELFNQSDPSASYMVQVIRDPYEPMPPLESDVPAASTEHVRNLILWVEKGFPEE